MLCGCAVCACLVSVYSSNLFESQILLYRHTTDTQKKSRKARNKHDRTWLWVQISKHFFMSYSAPHLNDVDLLSSIVPDFEFLGVSFHILCDSNSTHLPQNTSNISLYEYVSLRYLVIFIDIVFSAETRRNFLVSWDLNGIFFFIQTFIKDY